MSSKVLIVELKNCSCCSQLGRWNKVSHEMRLSAATKRARSVIVEQLAGVSAP